MLWGEGTHGELGVGAMAVIPDGLGLLGARKPQVAVARVAEGGEGDLRITSRSQQPQRAVARCRPGPWDC